MSDLACGAALVLVLLFLLSGEQTPLCKQDDMPLICLAHIKAFSYLERQK